MFNSVGIVLLLKRFVWDAKKVKEDEGAKIEKRIEDNHNKDEQIKNWIVQAITAQNEHCKVMKEYDLKDHVKNELAMEKKQTEVNNEIKDIRKELKCLSEAVIALTTEISHLKQAIQKLEGSK
jgi:predicted RNase H-like nuclease (RuvC/YqgF family)